MDTVHTAMPTTYSGRTTTKSVAKWAKSSHPSRFLKVIYRNIKLPAAKIQQAIQYRFTAVKIGKTSSRIHTMTYNSGVFNLNNLLKWWGHMTKKPLNFSLHKTIRIV
jgi:hypothetical protein